MIRRESAIANLAVAGSFFVFAHCLPAKDNKKPQQSHKKKDF